VPALVVREETERPECLATGFVRLVPPHRDHLRMEIERALELPRPRAVAFDEHAPFGDGRSGERIAAILAGSLARTGATA
ncbi:MAG TPA: UDP-N-acetylglucosamine 2-epimerase, partial [Xanthomonadales bacterium]|nr:UDP-N-acetylglucosamine 2-epimerase [Xanthomonadales bacterium]